MNERDVVMLSDSGAGQTVAEDLARHDVRVSCYTRIEDLFGEVAPAAIPVLVFLLRDRPKGRVLEVIGRLAVEHPRIQMVVASEVPLSLEVAEYLAGHDVQVMRMDRAAIAADVLPETVMEMHERRHWSLAAC